MSEKNQQPSELPQLVSLTEVQRRTNLSPGRIIRQCAQVWIDFTPADEDYRWLGRRLTAHPRDPLVPMNGICKLTEDGQQALANRTMSYLKWKGFALVKDLTVETETGILIVNSLSKGTCPPIPTPNILVPEEILGGLTDAVPTKGGEEIEPSKQEKIESLDPLGKLLFKFLEKGVDSRSEIMNCLKSEMRSTKRKFDAQGILLQWVDDDYASFRWRNGRREQIISVNRFMSRASELRKMFPELKK